VIDAYGLAHDIDGMTGIAETRPAVFLLDADRTVEYAWVAANTPSSPTPRPSAARSIGSSTDPERHSRLSARYSPHVTLFRDRHERIPVTKDTDTLRRAAEAVADGDLVVYPTETVYGLGGDALDPTAVERVFDLKGRERSNPLSLGVPSVDAALRYTKPTEFAVAFARVPPRPSNRGRRARRPGPGRAHRRERPRRRARSRPSDRPRPAS